jgi:PAS domain S-box-containing protein
MGDAALRRSDVRSAALLDAAFDCIVTIDHEGRITAFNAAAERTFGYRRAQVLGATFVEVILPPALRAQFRHGFDQELAMGHGPMLGTRVEVTAMRADGTEFPVQLAITGAPVDGLPAFICILRDITDRQQAIDERQRVEKQLAGEKHLLEMVALGRALPDVLTALCHFVEESATDGFCNICLVDWSHRRLRTIAGPSIPASYSEVLQTLPVEPETGPSMMAACTRTQVIAVDLETDPMWQDTAFRDLALAHGLRSCWATPVFALSGEVLGTFAILRRVPAGPTPLQQDVIARVTHIASIAIERALDEAALELSEAFLAQGQRLSSTGSFAWRVDTDDITFSDELRRIFEFQEDGAVTLERIAARIHPEDGPLFAEKVDIARRTGKNLDFEMRLKMPDDSTKYLRTIAHGTRNEDEQLEYIGAVQDVTARRLSEDALGKARSELAHVARVTALSTLTASIAHEVNQPLAGIITNASTCLRMLGADPPDLDGARETARRTIRDGNRASEVIARLRALFTKRENTTELVDLNEATREVLALSSSELQRSRVVLRLELAEDLPYVICDRVQMQQVTLNLVLNAADAMAGIDDRPRQVIVRTAREQGDRVRVSVQDVGIGLGADADAQTIDKLFDAFYTTKRGGMGIGLSVSRSIVERHQGRLWAESNEGPGATFSFSIPCRIP